MADPTEDVKLPQLEPLGDATRLAGRIHGMTLYSPMLENFSLPEIRLLSHFMQVFRAAPGVEIIREGEPGDFMMLLVEGRIEVFKQDHWNTPHRIAVLEAGATLGEMSMIDGEPRFASCIAVEPAVVTVLSRASLARIIIEQPMLGAKVLMELALMLSRRLRETSSRLVMFLDKQRELQEGMRGPGFI